MASPDFRTYIDLTINDKQPSELYTEAVEYARLALPEFSPRAGTVEDAILEAVSYVGAENLAAINRLPDGLMEGILKLMGVSRLTATFSTVDVEFMMADIDLTIPAEFAVVYETTDGNQVIQYPFYTTDLLTANEGEEFITATLTCSVAGPIPSLPIGTTLTIAQPDASVLSCQTTSLVTQGDTDESDAEFFSRATSVLALLNSTLVTASQIESYILTTYADVHRCKVYDLRKVHMFTPASGAQNASLTGSTATILTDAPFYSSADFSSGLFRILTGDFDGSNPADALKFPTGHFVPTQNAPKSVDYTNVFSGTGTTGPVSVIDMASLKLDTVVENAGYFAIFVCDKDGSPLSSAKKQEIYDDVDSKITAGLSFALLDAFPVDLKLTITIAVSDAYGSGDVATNLVNEIESYFSPGNWPDWQTTLRIFDVVVKASAVSGVAYVYSVVGFISEFADGAAPGNELLVTELTSGTATTGYEILYAGVLPRITAEVIVQ